MSFDPQHFIEEWKRRTEQPPPLSKGRWTLELRKRQSEAIHRWRPWESFTVPRTVEGKEKVAQNARRHGLCDRLVWGVQREQTIRF